MENQTIISCQISFYPLNTKEVNQQVKKVINLINESNLEYESNSLSTIIYGSAEKIYALLAEITVKMDEDQSEFSMSINISNSCGCEI
ncbi:MAG: YkoF family thiamine/hydroxymethylpyrimidine-binding protein [Bacillota bacterium]